MEAPRGRVEALRQQMERPREQVVSSPQQHKVRTEVPVLRRTQCARPARHPVTATAYGNVERRAGWLALLAHSFASMAFVRASVSQETLNAPTMSFSNAVTRDVGKARWNAPTFARRAHAQGSVFQTRGSAAAPTRKRAMPTVSGCRNSRASSSARKEHVQENANPTKFGATGSYQKLVTRWVNGNRARPAHSYVPKVDAPAPANRKRLNVMARAYRPAAPMELGLSAWS